MAGGGAVLHNDDSRGSWKGPEGIEHARQVVWTQIDKKAEQQISAANLIDAWFFQLRDGVDYQGEPRNLISCFWGCAARGA